MPLKVIMSGGGTGGHIYPAVAIANAIKKEHPDTEFLFVGSSSRMEMQKVPQAGFKIIGLWISGLQRSLSISNLLFPLKVIHSIVKSLKIVSQFKPDIAIGTGGFASGPLLYAATLKGVPTIIQEQNSYAGITNRSLAKKVKKVCVAYPKMERFFKPETIQFTGNPVRNDMVDIAGKRTEALEFFKLNPNKKTVLIVGGSLGARSINQAILHNLAEIKKANYQLLWQCGSYSFAETQEQLATEKPQNISLHEFIYKMDLAYAAADVVISRAGAIAISELCLVKKPSILVPLPTAAEDHQTKNAMALVNINAAILLKNNEVKEKLTGVVADLINDSDKQQILAENIVKLGKPDAANEIAQIALNQINNGA